MDNHSNDKKYIILPHSAYTKSLNSFKQGMHDMEKPKPKNKMTYVAGIGAAVLMGLLAFTFVPAIDNDNQDNPAEEPVEQKESEREEELVETEIDLSEIDVNEELLSNVLERARFETGSSWGDESFHNDEFVTYIPSDWQLKNEEPEFEHGSKTVITGQGGVKQTILIFDKEATEEEMDQAKEELISDYTYTEATEVPIETLKEYQENHYDKQFMVGKYKGRFAIELDEDTKMYTLRNEQEGRLYDYVEATLFDKKLVLFSDVGMNHTEKVAATYFTLSTISPANDYAAFKGPYDSKHGRPTTLTMVMGLSEWEFVDLHLYEHELGFTSYIREDATLEKIDHKDFTEWKFTDEDTTENRYYSFGKLDPTIPLEDIKLTLINGYGLDPKNIEGSSHVAFSHSEGRDTSREVLRSFDLVQKQGEWYYIYTQEDFSENFRGPSLYSLVSKFQQEIIFD